MMLSFNVNAEFVDSNGETMWTELTVQPPDGTETVDLKLPDDVILPNGGLIMVKPRELIRALEFAAAEADRTPDRMTKEHGQ